MCSCFVHDAAARLAMNAIPRTLDPDAAERTARHLRQLQELAELGMAMARAVAEEALHPAPAPEAAPSEPATAPTRTRRDPGLGFARLAHSVRQTIALEARIAAERDNPSPRPSRPPPPDPRRSLLRGALYAAAPGPHREAGRATPGGFRREIDERIEDELAADPGGDIPIHEILAAICGDLGITLDCSRLPDALLDMTDPMDDPADDPGDDPVDDPGDDPADDPASPAPPPGLTPHGPASHAPAPHGPDPP
jgi:hypothetical protein